MCFFLLISRRRNARETFFFFRPPFFCFHRKLPRLAFFFFFDGLLPPSPFLLLLPPPPLSLPTQTHAHYQERVPEHGRRGRTSDPTSESSRGFESRPAQKQKTKQKNWCCINTTNDDEKTMFSPTTASLACEKREKRNAKHCQKKKRNGARAEERRELTEGRERGERERRRRGCR